MSVKDKLLVIGVLFTIAVGFLGHHYWALAVEVLQRLVAIGFISANAIVSGHL
jgi:hypothetical protein